MNGSPLSAQRHLHRDDLDGVVRADPGDSLYVPGGVTRWLRDPAGQIGRLLGLQTPGGVDSPRPGYGSEFCRDGRTTRSCQTAPDQSAQFREPPRPTMRRGKTACEQ